MLHVLQLLAKESHGYTLTSLSEQLGMPKSTTSLLVQELCDQGFMMIDPMTRRCRTGPKLIQLSFRVVGQQQLFNLARPYLEHLSQVTGEDSYLAVRTGLQTTYVDKVEGSRSVRFDMRLGVPLFMHSTAVGRIMLAYGESGLLEQVIGLRGLPKLTPLTITDVDQLRIELAKVRAQGFAVTDGESVEGICGVAVPVRDHSGGVTAAIALSCLRSRYYQNSNRLIEQLLETTQQLRSVLGG